MSSFLEYVPGTSPVSYTHLAVLQHAHLQHGLLHLQLASEEEHERYRANERAGDSVGTQAVGCLLYTSRCV